MLLLLSMKILDIIMKVSILCFLSHDLVHLHFLCLDLHAKVIQVVLIKLSCGVIRITSLEMSFLYS